MTTPDVIVIGGGPAGSTAASLLAMAGRRVTLVERSRFPRFHIGESLLPASVRIFERLGVHERIREQFLHKPGGKWQYRGGGIVWADFAQSTPGVSFEKTPYSYMVERSRFDQLLLDRSRELGVEVHEGTEVRGLLEDAGVVRGVRVRPGDGSGDEVDLEAAWVVDASGARSVVANHFGLRRVTEPRRMAVYTHYRTRPLDSHLCEGWFVGQQIHDGWLWTIPISEDRISVGVVLSVEAFQRSGLSPEALMEHWMTHGELLLRGITRPAERLGEVHVTGSMGHTSTRLHGEGWALIGDAAYFIDPCWSSGVHLAMYSGELVADVLVPALAAGRPRASDFEAYSTQMVHHERQVRRMVDAFYMASRNPLLAGMITRMQADRTRRKAVGFIGGDFTANQFFVGNWYRASRLISALSDWAYPAPPPVATPAAVSASSGTPQDAMNSSTLRL